MRKILIGVWLAAAAISAQAVGAGIVEKLFLQSGAGAVPISQFNKNRQTVSITEFGAIPNDGVDDSQAIQSAVNSLVDGGTVIIPRGTYQYTTLIVHDGVTLSGEGPYATVLLCSTLTGDSIILGVSAGIEKLKLTASGARTGGRTVLIQKNGSFVRNSEVLNYFIAIDVSGDAGVAVNARLTDISFFSPSLTAGGALIIGSNYSNLVISKIVGAGPLIGTQPSAGIRLINGDTSLISDVNITLHGAALKLDPGVGQHLYATSISNSLFDSAIGHSSGEMTGEGHVLDTKISNTWFGLASGAGSSGLLIDPVGSGSVDGLALSGCEFPGNADSGLRVNGAGVSNVLVNGGWATGNTYGYNFSGGVTHFSIKNTRSGNVSFRGANTQYGAMVQAGASDYYDISGNDFSENIVGGLSDSGAGINKIIGPNL